MPILTLDIGKTFVFQYYLSASFVQPLYYLFIIKVTAKEICSGPEVTTCSSPISGCNSRTCGMDEVFNPLDEGLHMSITMFLWQYTKRKYMICDDF